MTESMGLEFSSEELIKYIENHALKDIESINISYGEERDIDFKRVHEWYLETEKIIRILANIIPSTMAQPINQLRYAGHHALKASCDPDDEGVVKLNLTEAYKHCKRAYYDSLDLYVFHMSDVFRSKLSLLAITDIELEDKIITHLESFTKLRLENESRINYYSNVSKTLLVGLSLIADINKRLRDSGVTDELLSDKSVLIKNVNILTEENRTLKKDYNHLNSEVKKSLAKADQEQGKRFNKFSLVLILVTAISILFQGFFTEKFITSKNESLLTVENLIDLKSYLNPMKKEETASTKTKKGYKYIQNVNK